MGRYFFLILYNYTWSSFELGQTAPREMPMNFPVRNKLLRFEVEVDGGLLASFLATWFRHSSFAFFGTVKPLSWERLLNLDSRSSPNSSKKFSHELSTQKKPNWPCGYCLLSDWLIFAAKVLCNIFSYTHSQNPNCDFRRIEVRT